MTELTIQPNSFVIHSVTETRTPEPTRQLCLNLLLHRNKQLNEQFPDQNLATKPTPEIEQTAFKLDKFTQELKKAGGAGIVGDFLSTPHNLIWMEQVLDLDPHKVATCLLVKKEVTAIFSQQKYEPQHIPTVSLGSYTAIEKLKSTGSDQESTGSLLAKFALAEKDPTKTRAERSLNRHLKQYLTALNGKSPELTGSKRQIALVKEISQDLYQKLAVNSRRGKILQQTQGVEVEVLQRLEYVPPQQRTTERLKKQMVRAEKLGITQWLPRGIELAKLPRTDWHLVTMLGLNEDPAEKKYEHFEMATQPTDASASQATQLLELTQAGFIDEKILSNVWEKYSLHVSTTFPSAIWNQRSHDQYVQHARSLSGAFSSIQRGVYGGYVWDDTIGREVAEKTLETSRFKPVEGSSTDTIAGQSLIEMRLFDLSKEGHYSLLLHKPFLDYAFRCYWQQQEGVPLKNRTEQSAANLWQEYYSQLQALNTRFNIPNEWHGVGWKKAQNPTVKQEYAKLIRQYSRSIIRLVDAELENPSSKTSLREKPIQLQDKHTLEQSRTRRPETAGLSSLSLSTESLKSLGINTGEVLTIRLGETTQFVEVKSQTTTKPKVTLDQDIFSGLDLPLQTELTLKYDSLKNELSLGPTLGIIANLQDSTLDRPFGEQTRYHKSLLEAAKSQGVFAFVFDPHDIDPENHRISALNFDSQTQRWIKVTVPYPDIVFDRNFSDFPEELRQAVRHIPYINPREFPQFIADKANLSSAIEKNPRFKPYVPETSEFHTLEDLQSMVDKHQTVYLKPTWGQRSYGVVRINKQPDNTYRFNFTRPSGNPEDESFVWPHKGDPDFDGYSAKSISEILTKTTEIRSGYRDYVIQQGIQMETDTDGEFMERRFLFQRNETGKIQLIGWHEGQRQKCIDEGFTQVFGKQGAQIVADNAANLATASALQIQSSFGGDFGQMSVQIAIDVQGKPWFLEANPKPGVTNQFDAYDLPEITDLATQSMVKFAAGLSGFSSQPVETTAYKPITLPEGTSLAVAEERNPYLIHQFAQKTLGKSINDKTHSVYNLKSIERIRENLAGRAKYLVLKNQGNIVACISLMRPYSQWLREASDSEKVFDTKPRWEVGGVLVDPAYRGKGLAEKMFALSINELKKAGAKEAIVNVSGTFNQTKAGTPRPDSLGIEKIVKKYHHSLLGHGITSYGPTYLIHVD